MLSGLTSQLGGLMGNVRKGQAEEGSGKDGEGSAGNSTPADTAQSPAGGQSPTGVASNSRSGSTVNESVLSSVRNQLPSWLGGGNKGAKDEAAAAAAVPNSESPVTELKPPATDKGRITPDKDSDASSATGGADSEKEQHLSDVDEAAGGAGLEKVKNLGNLIFSSIKGAGQKIKDTNVPNILAEFQKEHDSFLKAKGSKGDAIPPWVGHAKETALKEEIVSLSTDRRNFVRSPPTGVSFEWNFDEMLPIAKAILKEDPNLEKMRYELVPKVISEENFWRNYFYRVTLLKESLSDDEPNRKKQDSIETDEEDAELEKELNEELKSFEVVEGSGKTGTDTDDKEIDSLLDLK